MHICHNAGDENVSSACVLVLFSAPVSHRQRHCESPNELQTRPPRHPRVPRACNDSRVTMHAIWCPPHPIIAMSSSSKEALLESFPSSRICRFPFSSIASTKAPSPSTSRCASEAHRVLSRIPLPAFFFSTISAKHLSHQINASVHQQMLQAHPSGSSLAISACPSRPVR